MKIVIDIPEEVKEAFDKADDINFCFYDYNSVIGKAIQNGTPLPKNHGRLIDVDDLYENTEIYHSDIDGYACVRWKDINDAPTIIEGSDTE